MKRKWFLLIVLLIIVQLFIFTGCNNASKKASVDLEDTVNDDLLYINKAIVTETVADVFIDSDIKSERLTQAIYNQPLEIIEEKDDWILVETPDGCIGWVKSKFLVKDISSIQAEKYEQKVIITAKEKTISSQIKGGLTIKKVIMGTELYSNYETEDAYEVFLPGRKKGWINKTGTMEISINEKISETSAEDFTATAVKFKGTKYMIGGISAWGIDSSGLTYLCSRINGIRLPRNVNDQFNIGKKIDIIDIMNGDLIFFYKDKNTKEISEVGVYAGENQFIFSNKDKGYVTYVPLDSEKYNERIAGIRRIF